MIVDLPDTQTSKVNSKLIELRDRGGVNALGRVLTLIIVTDDGTAEPAIEVANAASREHPCRVITVVRGNRRGATRLDAQIRVGGDAGASEVIVLRLYGPLADHGDSVVVPFLLPDAPIVAWWPGEAPPVPATDPIGRIAQRRITDASVGRSPAKVLAQRAASYSPGDTDFAWSRITLWRGLIAAALDQPPYHSVRSGVVSSGVDSPSGDLLAAWLSMQLGCPVTRDRTRAGTGLISVRLDRSSGPIELVRNDGKVASLTQPGQPVRRIALAPRADRDCLSEELRRLDPDEVYGEVLTRGMSGLARRDARAAAKTVGKRPTASKPSTGRTSGTA